MLSWRNTSGLCLFLQEYFRQLNTHGSHRIKDMITLHAINCWCVFLHEVQAYKVTFSKFILLGSIKWRKNRIENNIIYIWGIVFCKGKETYNITKYCKICMKSGHFWSKGVRVGGKAGVGSLPGNSGCDNAAVLLCELHIKSKRIEIYEGFLTSV